MAVYGLMGERLRHWLAAKAARHEGEGADAAAPGAAQKPEAPTPDGSARIGEVEATPSGARPAPEGEQKVE